MLLLSLKSLSKVPLISKEIIQTTFPMRVPCITRQFLNSHNPGSLWHSYNINFHYLRIWLFPDLSANPSQCVTNISSSLDWMRDCQFLQHSNIRFSPGWNGTTCSCKSEAKDWVPKYCSVWLHYQSLRVQDFSTLDQMYSLWVTAGLQPPVKMESTTVHLLASGIGPTLPQETQALP